MAANYQLYYIALPKIRSALLKNRELHPAVFSDFSSLADDYLHSQQYGVGSVGGKEHAPAILAAFGQACAESGVTAPEQLTIVSLENALVGRLSRLDLPLPVRRGIPEMLRGFFEYLACSGSFPPAAEWAGWLSLIDKKYQARFRDDGTVRGETFKKKYSDVDRNDPCPCGSGKKFKKCCMNLIG